MLESLKKTVCQANLQLRDYRLVIYSWGNVSGLDRDRQAIVIKPSGVAYNDLTPDMMVVVDLEGHVLEGELKPSSDTPIHLELYRCLPEIEGICHTHSQYATMWAQAGKAIPCLGTTHGDFCYGDIPITDVMSDDEIQTNYEANTGKVIVRWFTKYGVDPLTKRSVLVAHHGPFTWGRSAMEAVESAVILEQIAAMAWGTYQINSQPPMMPQSLMDKHYFRKHGKDAYYGQK